MKNLPVAALLLVTALVQPGAAQTPAIRVVNAASNLPESLSPGTLIYILGPNLSNTTASTPDYLNLPNTLGGVSVAINGVPALLLFVSQTLIIAQIDPTTPTGPGALGVLSPVVNANVNVNILPVAAPGLFPVMGGPFSASAGAPSAITIWATGLDLSTPFSVTIGGFAAAVQSSGPLACCAGFQQMAVLPPPQVAGAGRVEVLVTSGGLVSNAVDAVILPNGAGPSRNRAIGAVAYLPVFRAAMVADEADDVLRVIDMKQRAVIRTVALPTGSLPSAIAVDDLGMQAAVIEHGRNKLAIVDIQKGLVIAEIPVGSMPSSVAINGDLALVANQNDDTVALISLVRKQILAFVTVGHGPRSIAIDGDAFRAYVANENGGTVSVIDLARREVTATLQLGPNARPRAVVLVPSAGMLAVTQPNAGIVDFFDLSLNKLSTARAVANDLAFQGGAVYFANQTVGSVAPFSLTSFGISTLSLSPALPVDPGVRSLALDPADNLLLMSSESTGKLWLIELARNTVAGSINAVRSENETDGVPHDDRTDRDRAGNAPAVVSITPREVAAGSTVDLAVNGPNLAGTYDAFFAGPAGVGRDPAFSITRLEVDPGGAQLRLTVQIAAGAALGDHLLRAFAWNGETGVVASPSNTLTVR